MVKEVQKLRVYSSDKGKHVAVELENITCIKNDTRKRKMEKKRQMRQLFGGRKSHLKKEKIIQGKD